MQNKVYLCIDLKTFYASVECVERGLDPFTTKLVVADPDRCTSTICLAISPAMKALGIKNRCRVFEIPNNIDYIKAKPRMKKYIEYSANIYAIYLKYISKDDIYPYSIDECFLDITNYLLLYKKTPIELAKMIINDVFSTTGITATAGIGDNLFQAKVALDIISKHSPDNIGYLNDELFKEKVWHHKPLSDIWQIGRGIERRLLKYNIHTLYDITCCNEEILYKEFGINAEILIDHAYGREIVEIADIKAYKPKAKSISHSQILGCGYEYKDAYLAFIEMIETSVLDLIDRKVCVGGISIYITYKDDGYKPLAASIKLDEYTQSYMKLREYLSDLFIKNVYKEPIIRSIGIGFFNIVDEIYETQDLFTDSNLVQKEKNLAKAILGIKKKYGKNSVLKGMNYLEKATTKERNTLVGGHAGGEEGQS